MALRSEIAAAEALLQQQQQIDEAKRKVLLHSQWRGILPASNGNTQSVHSASCVGSFLRMFFRLFTLLQNAMTAVELSGRDEELRTRLNELQDSRAALEASQAALEVDSARQEHAATDLRAQIAAETAAWHGETAPCILDLLQL